MKFLIYFFSVIIAQISGLIGSIFTTPQIENWYLTLNKPTWNPPSVIFAPVWVTLYLLMGVTAARVYFATHNLRSSALVVYVVQLVVNITWSFVFFGTENVLGGLIVILTLLVLLLVNFYLFWKIDRVAAMIFSPYIAWVGFASILNYNIWLLN